jgi:hypothetical protein
VDSHLVADGVGGYCMHDCKQRSSGRCPCTWL